MLQKKFLVLFIVLLAPLCVFAQEASGTPDSQPAVTAPEPAAPAVTTQEPAAPALATPEEPTAPAVATPEPAVPAVTTTEPAAPAVATPEEPAAPGTGQVAQAGNPPPPPPSVLTSRKGLDLQLVPLKSQILKGVPPQSTTSQITLGIIGTDVDNFLSPTGSPDVSYSGGFGYAGFDMNSLSIGISRKFLGAITSLYYSGNIIEDMFGYIQNNPGPGEVSIEAIEGLSGSDYELLGELNGKNNLNSRTTVNVLFGAGSFGINLGYSQHLTGYVSADPGNPFPSSGQDAYINTGKNALLDNSIAPSIEVGLTFGGRRVIVRTTLAATFDIHSYRDFKQGSMVNLSNYFMPGNTGGTYTITDNVTEKTLADYYEPAGLLRAEFEFPTDERSRAAIAIEGGYRHRIYSNADDKGNTINGKYYSRKTGLQGERGFEYTATEISDWGIIARPSIRYISAVTDRLRVGLNGGVGLNMDFGKETSMDYHYLNFMDYQNDTNPVYDNITTRLTGLSLAVNPLLGIGMVFEIVPGRFKVNAGAGAEQTLYRFSVGTDTTNIGGNEVETPLFTQEWGKPEAQLGLGATFMFGRPEISENRYTLDAMFSSNGIELGKSNFVVQFSARF